MKPPFPAVAGAWACPTLLNNVETFSAIPAIIRDGGAAFAALGTPKNGGTRLVCISGHVNKPGVYEVPLGYPMMKAINEVAGGIPGGKKLKAVVPGGSSCPILKADECDIPMDYDTLAKIGSMLGSGGMVVMDETTDMVKVALRIMRFYAHESCGWCIPCREGTTWLQKDPARGWTKAAAGAKTSRCWASFRKTCWAGRSARWAMRRRCRRSRSSTNSRKISKSDIVRVGSGDGLTWRNW